MSFFGSHKRADTFRTVFAFLWGHWRRRPTLLAAIMTGMLVATLGEVLVPIFVGRLVDALSTAQGGAEAARLVARAVALNAFLAILALGAVTVLVRHFAFMGIVTLTLRMMSDIAADAFARVQRFSSDWHANAFAGSTVRKISRGMWSLDLLNDTIVMALLPSLVVLAGSALVLGLYWPVMGLLVGTGAVLYVAMTLLLSTAYVAPAARLSNAWDTKVGGTLADAVSCNAVVKGFGTEAREEARLAGVLAKWNARTTRTWRAATWSGTAQLVALLALQTGIVGTALVLWWNGQASPGDVAYVLTTEFVVHGYLREVGMHVHNLQRSVNEMEELVELHRTPIAIADKPGAVPARVERGAIAFEAVRFHYQGHEKPLYDNLSLSIDAGERVGLVGHSGSGKTTFVKLIQRLHDVTGGRVLVDGQDVRDVQQGSLRRSIAVVAQEPILFHRSLAENIAYGRPDATRAEIERAAALANASGFIERLPRGYGTLVGERGVKLSGGERQRIAIARAFLADARILILDEATSSLDSESEALIQEAMERLMVGRTTLVIAHRLSTVRSLDRLLVFDKGRIVEEGDHDALVARENGLYRRLFERQALDLVKGLAA
ncbi:MAG: multidrug ABC transporter ATP-binding protein [Rhizobiales bacterium 24-66-13]|jgi:ATP-binding cassette subfamily B protein|nr:MAG: multidrug ABC transporter ATP-binding protein [Rhizobiales bacterium 24-66-13]OZA98364.1 MAG: multidrug ABC transporter ATP-binding protein [Rhizobiales bacterium 39-66-18]HQS07719.1 ABC transporter ATP-binding protein [Xanthobacteraceae bacterium]HQS49390.1 ABC transporter ATP-binding protein [Xanthobacteraceae bacterium]